MGSVLSWGLGGEGVIPWGSASAATMWRPSVEENARLEGGRVEAGGKSEGDGGQPGMIWMGVASRDSVVCVSVLHVQLRVCTCSAGAATEAGAGCRCPSDLRAKTSALEVADDRSARSNGKRL